jgi:hypothetical protein
MPAPQPPTPVQQPAPAPQPPTPVQQPAPMQVALEQAPVAQPVVQQPVQPAPEAVNTQPVQQPVQPTQPVQPVQQPLPTGPGMVYQQPVQTWQNIDQTRVSQIQKKNNMIVFAFLAVPIIVVIILFFASGMGGSKVEKSAISGKSARQIEAEVNTLRNEALTYLTVADNFYTEVSMNSKDSYTYLKNSSENKYKAMCVSLNGLVLNGYLNKDLENGKIRGVILIEVPFDGGATKRSIWVTNETYAITGYEKEKISSLRYAKENNEGLGTYYYTAPSKQGVVTDITKADSIINVANGKTPETGANIIKDENGNTIDPSLAFTNNSKNIRLKAIQSPSKGNGGTGYYYRDIICINNRI